MILIHGCITEVMSIAMYCTLFRSSLSLVVEDKDCLVKLVTCKESDLNGCENRDNSSDFHGRNATIQLAILVNDGGSMRRYKYWDS